MTPTRHHSLLNRRFSRRSLLALAATLPAATILACSREDGSTVDTTPDDSSIADPRRPEGWTDATHGNDTPPDYAVVFARDRVQRLTLSVSPQDWQRMLDDMTQRYGPRDRNSGRSPLDEPDGNPIWVPATIGFNGRSWLNAGLRFKGSSSLRRSWQSGSDKLPFKLDFDEFEDDFPAIDNQRFYGFKQLSLSNNLNDATMIRETLSYDVLREAGLVAAETAFFDLILDYGAGPKPIGLYTLVEVIDDTVIRRSFEDSGGNIYEAEGVGAAFAPGTQDQIPSSFQVESNEEQADWSDIRALSDILLSPRRTEDPSAWRAALEAVFDVDAFLEWLAVAALLQHWDAYGSMPHNYYLYNDPGTGRLTWISWDHNLVLTEAARQGERERVDFDKRDAGEDWPLISALLAQPEYFDRYNAFLSALLEGPFQATKLRQRVDTYAALLAPIASNETDAFTPAVEELKQAIDLRIAAAKAYLSSL